MFLLHSYIHIKQTLWQTWPQVDAVSFDCSAWGREEKRDKQDWESLVFAGDLVYMCFKCVGHCCSPLFLILTISSAFYVNILGWCFRLVKVPLQKQKEHTFFTWVQISLRCMKQFQIQTCSYTIPAKPVSLLWSLPTGNRYSNATPLLLEDLNHFQVQ